MPKRVSMADKILDNLRDLFIDGDYQFGELLTENEISAKYGCSKTPAREAFHVLCMEGYLEKIPNKGYIVKAVSVGELQHMLYFRCVLECASVDLAVRCARDEDFQKLEKLCEEVLSLSQKEASDRHYELNSAFHIGLAQITRNPYLISATSDIIRKLRRALTVGSRPADNPRETLEDHKIILEAISQRDRLRAKELMEEHLVRAQNHIFRYEKNVN